MTCPHCNDPKRGEFPGIGVRCKVCKKRFYAARNGIGYASPPWLPWLRFFVLIVAGGGVTWSVARFATAGDFTQVIKTVVYLMVLLVLGECIRRYATIPEV